MKKFANMGLLVLVALGVVSLAVAQADAATYKLEFMERDGGDDFEGTLVFTNVKRTVNTPSSVGGTLTVDGRTYQLNGTHWWPQSGSLPRGEPLLLDNACRPQPKGLPISVAVLQRSHQIRRPPLGHCGTSVDAGRRQEQQTPRRVARDWRTRAVAMAVRD